MSERERGTALRVAVKLEKIIAGVINAADATWDALQIRPFLRVPLWLAIARRAEAKAAECEREAGR